MLCSVDAIDEHPGPTVRANVGRLAGNLQRWIGTLLGKLPC
jgi:hypothetical protein